MIWRRSGWSCWKRRRVGVGGLMRRLGCESILLFFELLLILTFFLGLRKICGRNSPSLRTILSRNYTPFPVNWRVSVLSRYASILNSSCFLLLKTITGSTATHPAHPNTLSRTLRRSLNSQRCRSGMRCCKRGGERLHCIHMPRSRI